MSKIWEKADLLGAGIAIMSIIVAIAIFVIERQSQDPPSVSASSNESTARIVMPLQANPPMEISRCQPVEVEGDDPPPGKQYAAGVWAKNVKNPDGSRGRHYLLRTLDRVPGKPGSWHTKSCMNIGEAGNDTEQYDIFLAVITDDLAERVEANASQPVSDVNLPSGAQKVDEVVVKRLSS